ncbi:MAG: antitoxin Xre/MbcA/ParS toxin-binding domain-containing protein [Methylomonas sp.]
MILEINAMMLVSPEKIASIMSLKQIPHTYAELDEMIVKGLPKTAINASIERIFTNTEDRKQLRNQIIPEATYKRRRETLSAEESGRAERLARIIANAEYVWNSESDARAFLTTPHPMLRDRTPLEVSMTEVGARRVEELLWQIYYGIAA